jgi:hypothetical protein
MRAHRNLFFLSSGTCQLSIILRVSILLFGLVLIKKKITPGCISKSERSFLAGETESVLDVIQSDQSEKHQHGFGNANLNPPSIDNSREIIYIERDDNRSLSYNRVWLDCLFDLPGLSFFQGDQPGK